jgi:hypothetical protein
MHSSCPDDWLAQFSLTHVRKDGLKQHSFQEEDFEKVKSISWKFQKAIKYRLWLMPQPMKRKSKM